MITPQTMTAEQLLRWYEEGRITVNGLILNVLSSSVKRRLTTILEALPADILVQLKDFVDSYRPGMRVFHGPRPKVTAVRFVREWFNSPGRTIQVSKKRDLRKSGTS
jgi:hypothetical protein